MRMKAYIVFERGGYEESDEILAVRKTEDAAKNLVGRLDKEWQKWHGEFKPMTFLEAVRDGPGYDYQVVDMDEEDSVVVENQFRYERQEAEKKRKRDLQRGELDG